ncbi:hypothetical protein [Streptomyces sp. SPB78]|uniref:hypothetical protein n=1 Tax=Streptomyces sp. (strain SPB78) TaxID=591157 RepID=UPI001F38C16A|nr:hypothetical protein [Streptomyces sp. SPB78]
MLGTKMKRALAMGGASLALAGAGVMAASPAFAATTVVAWTHGNVHAGPAKGERVVSYVNANYSYTGLCWLEGDLVNDHGISNCKLGPPPAQQRRDRLRQRRLLKGQRQGQRAQPLLIPAARAVGPASPGPGGGAHRRRGRGAATDGFSP